MDLRLTPFVWVPDTEPRQVTLYTVEGLPQVSTAYVSRSEDGTWHLVVAVGQLITATRGYLSPEEALAALAAQQPPSSDPRR